jgi:hypothetical protein
LSGNLLLGLIKASKNYATTGGWEFAGFKNGKPSGAVLHKLPCHQLAKDRDNVFTHYAPTP